MKKIKKAAMLLAVGIVFFASAQADARKGAERVGARKPVPVQEASTRETDVHISVDQSILADGAKASDVPSVMTLEQLIEWLGGVVLGQGGTDPAGSQEVALGVLEAEEAGKEDINDLDPDLIKKIEDLLKRYPRKNTTVTSINSGVAYTAGRDMKVINNAPTLMLGGGTSGAQEVIVVEEIESIEPAVRGFGAIGYHHGNHRFLPDWHDRRSRFRGLRHPGR